jgi:beta-N-acetylhexosaminidase
MLKNCVSADHPVPGVLMLDLAGQSLSPDEMSLLREPQVGGVILFSRNVSEPAQVWELTNAIRACNPGLLIAVDQEGGRVQRLREAYTRLPPMRALSRRWEQDAPLAESLAVECGWLMAVEVLASGIDFSFAPVLDLDCGISEVIGDRAFGSEPAVVSKLASAFMRGMHAAGMASTGKHFPGHGNVRADSHTEIPVDVRSLEQIRQQDLRPFIDCIDLLDAIMPAHVIYTDADPHCAGFSEFWLQTVLRGELGFKGVIFSDDLAMAGAAAAGGIDSRVDAALNAGCDMILVCNDRGMALAALAHLQQRAPALNPRLPAMRRRQLWSDQALRSSERWHSARAAIEHTVGAAG